MRCAVAMSGSRCCLLGQHGICKFLAGDTETGKRYERAVWLLGAAQARQPGLAGQLAGPRGTMSIFSSGFRARAKGGFW